MLFLRITCRGEVNPYYGMREIIHLDEWRWVQVLELHCILNVQHDCHGASCQVTYGRNKQVERKKTSIKIGDVTHKPTNTFILNSASYYYAEVHRSVAYMTTRLISPTEWSATVHNGLKVWDTVPIKSRKTKTTDQSKVKEDGQSKGKEKAKARGKGKQKAQKQREEIGSSEESEFDELEEVDELE